MSAHQTDQGQQQGSLPEGETESKKARRTGADKTPVSNKNQLPSPVTNLVDSTETTAATKGSKGSNDDSPARTRDDAKRDAAADGHTTPRKAEEPYELSQALSSPPQDTQPMTQLAEPNSGVTDDEEEDESLEGIWGYLVPLDARYGDKPLVLKKRSACPRPDQMELAAEKEKDSRSSKPSTIKDEEAYERTKTATDKAPSGGYLIGRHPECGTSYIPWMTQCMDMSC